MISSFVNNKSITDTSGNVIKLDYFSKVGDVISKTCGCFYTGAGCQGENCSYYYCGAGTTDGPVITGPTKEQFGSGASGAGSGSGASGAGSGSSGSGF